MIPATIFTGFLGSGKTTIIANLVKNLEQQQQKVLFIKNELGYEDIDTQMVKGEQLTTKSLPNGSVYHTLTGPMNTAIDQILTEYHPDRIIIETAGTDKTADPVKLAITIKQHPQLFLDGLITVIDVVNFNGYEYLDDYHKDKSNFVDLIVFNKVELADDQRKQAVVGYVREYNEYSPIVESPYGQLHPSLAVGINLKDMMTDLSIQPKDHTINAFTYSSDKTFDKTKLEAAFKKLPNNVIRFKGAVQTEQGAEIVNGVFDRFDWLPNPIENQVQETKLIMMGYRVDKNETEITQLLEECKI